MGFCEICGRKTQKNFRRCSEHRYCEGCGAQIRQGRWCSDCAREQKRLRTGRYNTKHYRNVGMPKIERIERRCLKCDRKFMAEGRFNRICPKCNEINSGAIDPYYAYGAEMR